jgi:1L-myo-inositol 1-phosphate cytidylyltransferase / CDP-L-myo-inositol myo-inositolphosphotransferase
MTSRVSGPVSEALILAAGRGSRLGHETAKPLFPLFGVPLLGRTLFTLEQAGVTDAYIVLGYNGDAIRRGIERIERLRIRVHWVENPRWQEPNGVSVLAAEAFLERPFILTMSDHLFEAATVERLQAMADGLKGLVLAVDREPDEGIDLEDATKVRLDGDRILDIGKGLTEYDAVDTGVFLASPELFTALHAVEKEGEGPSLSDGVLHLAARGQARISDATDLVWQDMDTREDVRAAERKLLARWPKPTDGPVSRMINRPISKAISRRLAPLGVTPNQVSLVTLVLGILSGVFAGVGGYAAWLASGALFQLGSILDGTDGELAILTFRASPQGAWIDTVCDNITYLAFLSGLTFGVYRAEMPPLYFWAGIAGFLAAAVSLGNINFYLLREGKSGSALTVKYHYQERATLFARVWQILHYFGKRDLLSFLAFFLAAIGQLPLALPMFGVGATLFLLPATTTANVSLFLRTRRLAAGGE